MTARNYCFTSFEKEQPLFDEEKVRYLIYQKELSPETNKEHWQGYVELYKPIRLPGLKRLLGSERIHVERRRGDRNSARDYCRKEESRIDGPYEFGTWIGTDNGSQGTRTDLRDAVDSFKKYIEEDPRNAIKRLCEEHTTEVIKYSRGFEFVRAKLCQATRTEETEGVLVYGESGTGKSYWVGKQYPGAYWRGQANHDNFEGYEGQETVIFDEFKGWITHALFTQLVGNSYDLRVNIKFSSYPFTAKLCIFVSNYLPENWYSTEKGLLFRPIERRLSRCLWFRKLEQIDGIGITPQIEEFRSDGLEVNEWERKTAYEKMIRRIKEENPFFVSKVY